MKTIQNFILGLDGQQKAIISYLDQKLTADYDLQGKISYNVPFYYRKSWICYLNPLKDGGVELAFIRGNELSNDQKILDSKGRKKVAGIDLYDVSKIPEQQIHEIIHEAIIVDDSTKYTVRKAK